MSRDAIRNKFKLTDPTHLLALGFGSGLARFAPGTFGTLAAIPFFLLMSGLAPLQYLSIVSMVCLAGIYLCGKCADDVGVHDHPAIVWDEFAGFFITMFLVPATWQNILVGFIIFRIFDIFKPWPIGVLDRKMRGGFGIMVDDILAGFYSLAIMHALLHFNVLS